MNILWMSANKLGICLLKEAVRLLDDDIRLTIMTLSEDSKTVMYDGVSLDEWYQFGYPIEKIERATDSIERIRELEPDLVIMCGWRQIISKELLSIPRLGWIGFHPTMLPKGRGPAPIINSILSGWKESGVTMFYLSEGLDDGDIVGQQKFIIDEHDSASDVYEKVIDSGEKLIKQFLPLLIKNKAPKVKQNESLATVFKKPTLKENQIDFSKDSIENIYRKVRALSKPYRGAYVKLGNEKLIIWNASREMLTTQGKR